MNSLLKYFFLHSHQDFLPGDLESVSDEHNKSFHQDWKIYGEKYQGLPKYAWGLLLVYIIYYEKLIVISTKEEVICIIFEFFKGHTKIIKTNICSKYLRNLESYFF